MSTDTATTRLSEREVAEHFSDVLDRVANGERIIIERGGDEVALIVPTSTDAETRSNVPLPAATEESVFDDEFVRNITEFRNEVNAARFTEWPE